MRSLQVSLPLTSQTLSSLSTIMETSLLQALFAVAGLALLLWLLAQRKSPADPLRENNISDERVTISELQVALIDYTEPIQQKFSTLMLNADKQSPLGLASLLQESAFILLQCAESWTHVHAESQTLPNLNIALKVLNQMMISERSNINADPLVNRAGNFTQPTPVQPTTREAVYLVVTLLVGTSQDQPLFEAVETDTALQSALENVATLPPDSLCFLELMWSPQKNGDRLTYNELLSNYTDLAQI